MKKNVLISLYRGYGMGDAVQVSAVLRHLKKHRPDWEFDFQAQKGHECVGRGIARRSFAYGDVLESSRSWCYDEEFQIVLRNTWYGWKDRPNTRVSSALHERFDLGWDAECGRYQIQVSPEVAVHVGSYIPPKAVAIHYKGDSCPDEKNLTDDQAHEICDAVFRLGHIPLLLDWRHHWPLSRDRMIRTIAWHPYMREYGGIAEYNCAVISQCRAFIGIDSGPAKCASATDTPSLVVWTKHHPAEFHDPAPNTTHLVPARFHGMKPVCNDPGVVEWFNAHYNFRQYYNSDLIGRVKGWLVENLG